MQSELKILFLDDHPGLRDGTALLLQQKSPELRFFCAGSAAEAEEILRREEIPLALIDLNLDGEDGISFIKGFRSVRPRLKVIVYTMHADPFHVKNALLAGVQGYVTKDADVDELLRAVHNVAGGGSFFCPAASQMMGVLLAGSPPDAGETDALFLNYQTLSKGEQELFELFAKKIDIAEIQRILGKKEKTILNKRTAIYQKLGLGDRLDLIEAARTLGVIE